MKKLSQLLIMMLLSVVIVNGVYAQTQTKRTGPKTNS